MNKYVTILLLLAMTLTGCQQAAQEQTTVPAETVVFTESETAVEAIQEFSEETTLSTETSHSRFYIPGVDVEDVIRYFNEVCLDAEMINSGNPKVLQKWTTPIYYILNGDMTEEDLLVLSDFCSWLNTLEGFPGIFSTEDELQANLRIHFCDQTEMVSIMGDDFSDLDGAVTFWYSMDEIYDAIICYRMDLNQYLRNSVILEEIYNGLGPIQDTDLRPDSIIYSGYSEPQSLTEMDKLILELLYHPQMTCRMDEQSCGDMIRQLYY